MIPISEHAAKQIAVNYLPPGMADSIFRRNQAIGGNGGPGHGGGIRVEGTPTGRIVACVVHSQVTDNGALGGRGGANGGQDGEGIGGGVWLDSTAEVGLVGTDVRDNFASTSDPDIFGDFSEECVP